MGVVKSIEGRVELNLNAVVTSLCYPDEWEVVEEFRTTVQEEKEHLY